MADDRNTRFQHFRDGCELAPEGKYLSERLVRFEIGEAVDSLMRTARQFGMKPCNSDGAHNVEAVIYEWLTKGTTFGAACEGLSKHPRQFKTDSDGNIS